MSKAMQRGPNGIIWSITQSGFIIPFIIGVVFFDNKASIIRYIGFTLTIVSLFMIGLAQKEEKKEYSNWLLLTFVVFFITGISQALSNLPSYFSRYNEISSVWRTFFTLVGLTLGALASPFTDGTYKNYCTMLKENILKKQTWIYCLFLMSFDIIGNYFLLYPGMDSLAKAGAGSITYPVMVGACIIGFEIYSIVKLKEKRNLIQYIALFLCLAGVASLAF
jgi:multidrug transporter EmrE-like cation transporter